MTAKQERHGVQKTGPEGCEEKCQVKDMWQDCFHWSKKMPDSEKKE